MSFKIVATRENGKDFLSIVPYQWEKDGLMKWPTAGQIKQKAFLQMLLDGNSIPQEHWISYKCICKRRNLSYDCALTESKRMGLESDTDADKFSSAKKVCFSF